MGRLTVSVACAASLVVGLFFIFVWAPHPWGWEGFDDYGDLGRTLARGQPFPTMDRPWGYAYYLAPFYRVFGDRLWIPLIVQAVLNALVPLVVYEFARREFDQRVAAVAALLSGFLSFNTVYASTQSSDAVCNVIFIAAVALVAVARRRGDWRHHAAAGALLGIASQFRPNLILVPFVLAVFLVVERRTVTRVAQACVLLMASAATLMPWVVRNYRLTGELILTSTRGGVQLWYGTLQTGPYLKNFAYNPRSVFEAGSFPYTSLDRAPLIVTGRTADCAAARSALAAVYWTDRDPVRHRVQPRWLEGREFRADIPPSPAPTAYYFFFDGAVPSRAAAPYVYLVSGDHLGDIDRHGDLLDVFDLVRLLRHLAWDEPVEGQETLDFDGDGRLSEADARQVANALLAHEVPPHPSGAPARVDAGPASAVLRWGDGSSIEVPRAWSGRITDVEATGALAAKLVHSTVPFALLRAERAAPAGAGGCETLDSVEVNALYYRQEPHQMRRYLALAMDNIRRDPPAYLAAVAYRVRRVFFIEGSDDPNTVQQFTGSRGIYRIAHAATVTILVLFAVGVWAAWRRGAAIALPLLLIAYIPATLAFVLTNMKYSITVQPLLFMFVAAALVTGMEATGIWPRRGPTSGSAAPGRASTGTAHSSGAYDGEIKPLASSHVRIRDRDSSRVSRSLWRWMSGESGGSYGSETPVKRWISPRSAFAYRPFLSRRTSSSRAHSTKTSTNGTS